MSQTEPLIRNISETARWAAVYRARESQTAGRTLSRSIREAIEFVHELGNIFKLKIHRCESHVGNLVEFFQPPHDRLADLAGGPLAFGRFLNVLFNRINDRVRTDVDAGDLIA